MESTDSPLEVDLVGGHVVGTDLVVDAAAAPPDSGHHVITGLEFGDVGADGLDAAEVLVAHDQEVVALGRRAVLGGIDLFVGAVHATAQQAHQHAATVRHLIH